MHDVKSLPYRAKLATLHHAVPCSRLGENKAVHALSCTSSVRLRDRTRASSARRLGALVLTTGTASVTLRRIWSPAGMASHDVLEDCLSCLSCIQLVTGSVEHCACMQSQPWKPRHPNSGRYRMRRALLHACPQQNPFPAGCQQGAGHSRICMKPQQCTKLALADADSRSPHT